MSSLIHMHKMCLWAHLQTICMPALLYSLFLFATLWIGRCTSEILWSCGKHGLELNWSYFAWQSPLKWILLSIISNNPYLSNAYRIFHMHDILLLLYRKVCWIFCMSRGNRRRGRPLHPDSWYLKIRKVWMVLLGHITFHCILPKSHVSNSWRVLSLWLVRKTCYALWGLQAGWNRSCII